MSQPERRGLFATRRPQAGQKHPASPGGSEPIFIVGVPRSGTTLLAAMLSSHTQLDCGPETHFFSATKPGILADAAVDPDWPRKAVDVLCSLTIHAGRRIHEDFGFSREQLTSYLTTREPGVPAMLEALTAQHAAMMGKSRWIEKTPPHLQCLKQIRRHYPDAPIVRIVRDPRDVVASLCRMPWSSDSPVVNAYLVADRDEEGRRFFGEDSNAATVRYEDLLADPRRELGKVCGLIGEDFDPCMLETSGSAAMVVRSGEWYKSRVGRPLDTSSVGRWKRDLSASDARAVQLICASFLDRYGYGAEAKPSRVIPVYQLTSGFVEQHEDAITELAGRGTIMVHGENPMTPGTSPTRASVLVPDSLAFGAGRLRRLWNLLSFCWRCLKCRLSGTTICWIDCPRSDTGREGRAGALQMVILRLLGRRVSLNGMVAGLPFHGDQGMLCRQ